MSFIDLAKKRYSSRSYKEQAVEEEKILKVLEAGRIAPSAVNFQPWHFIVVRDDENRAKVAECYKKPWLKAAPAIIVVCGNYSESWKRFDGKDHCDIDIAIATDHMTLQASELGLSTCWVCMFDSKKCAEILGLPSDIEPMVLLPIGYPDDTVDVERHEKRRKKLDEIVHWEKF